MQPAQDGADLAQLKHVGVEFTGGCDLRHCGGFDERRTQRKVADECGYRLACGLSTVFDGSQLVGKAGARTRRCGLLPWPGWCPWSLSSKGMRLYGRTGKSTHWKMDIFRLDQIIAFPLDNHFLGALSNMGLHTVIRIAILDYRCLSCRLCLTRSNAIYPNDIATASRIAARR